MVISDSITATDMRAELVNELEREIAKAKRRAEVKGLTRLETGARAGYLAALNQQLDFWKNVMVQGSLFTRDAAP